MTAHLIILGSNITPERALPEAVARLRETFGEVRTSRVVIAPAVGAPGTPDFHNQAVLVLGPLDAGALRSELRAIEAAMGRVRTEDRNAPRIIDIDRVASVAAGSLDEAERATEPLADPPADPELARHAHLFVPAADLLPDLVVPGETRSLAHLAGDPALRPAGFRVSPTAPD